MELLKIVSSLNNTDGFSIPPVVYRRHNRRKTKEIPSIIFVVNRQTFCQNKTTNIEYFIYADRIRLFCWLVGRNYANYNILLMDFFVKKIDLLLF